MSNRSKKGKEFIFSTPYPEFLKYPMSAEWSKRWFKDHEVLYIKPEDQKEVILNPGKEEEWFRKAYPVKGEVVLTRMKYIPDLPHDRKGRIIAVTAVPVIKRHEFEKLTESMTYEEIVQQKLIKPKAIGTFFELFQADGGGYKQWVSPKEYKHVNSRKNRRKTKGLRGGVAKDPSPTKAT